MAVIKYRHPQPPDFLDEETYLAMLVAGVAALSGDGDGTGWLKALLPPGAVGLKTNCLAAFNPTLTPLVDALTGLLVSATGRDENDVIVWERSNRELKNAGYSLNVAPMGRRCLGTDTNGVGYDEEFYTSGPVNSMITRILTQMVAHSINLPILKHHSIAGMSGGLKNMYGAVHNPNKYHGNNCSPFAADINNLAPIRDKHRLTIIDAVRVQYDRGPGFSGSSMDYYYGLILSTDPVAADRVAQEILASLRKKNDCLPLVPAGRPVTYLADAEKLGLGTADLAKMKLAVIDVDAAGNQSPGALL